MATKKQKYMVVRAGTCLKGIEITPVGTIVTLTAEKAAAMVGKVRLLDEYEAELKADADLIKENKALTKANDELTATNSELGGVNADLTEQLVKLTEQLTSTKSK